MAKKQQPSLQRLSEQFSSEQPDLWAAILGSVHTAPAEQRAVARSVVKEILSSTASRYANAFYVQTEALYPLRPFAAYSISAIGPALPTFAKRASKQREKTVLGWVYCFLQSAGEQALLDAFEASIAAWITD